MRPAGSTRGSSSEGRPIRVVMFYGPFLRSARKFALRLDAHPDIELAAAWCAAPGETRRHQFEDLRRRRGWLGVVLFAAELARDGLRRLLGGRAEREHRRRWAELTRRIHYVEDMHDPAVLDAVRELEPELGVGYGGPILRPELFRIPRHGTLGIHHGRLPEFRGKKTTFWEIWEGESTAGVTIQRIDEGVDTGEIVAQGSVEIGTRGYEAVWQAVQQLGVDLYVDAVLAIRDGTATFRRTTGPSGPLRKDPSPAELMRLPLRRIARRFGRRRDVDRGRPEA